MRVTIATSPAKSHEQDFAAATANGVVLLDEAGLAGTAPTCSHGVASYTHRKCRSGGTGVG